MSTWNYPENCSVCGNPTGKRRAKGMCRQCYMRTYVKVHHDRVLELERLRYKHNKTKIDTQNREAYRKLHRLVIRHLGNQCACCGETHWEFLAIDHIHGGGNRHRRVFKRQGRLYREIRDEGFPRDKYRILCHNCNMSLGHYGYCPHSESKPQQSPTV